jgi:hypothetical protein
MLNWILSRLFPPRISRLGSGGMHDSFGYLDRIARKHLPKNAAGMSWGRVSKVEEKRIIYLPGRVL